MSRTTFRQWLKANANAATISTVAKALLTEPAWKGKRSLVSSLECLSRKDRDLLLPWTEAARRYCEECNVFTLCRRGPWLRIYRNNAPHLAALSVKPYIADVLDGADFYSNSGTSRLVRTKVGPVTFARLVCDQFETGELVELWLEDRKA